ncbi:hypothetical protein SDC9_75670 [bioreactor metagenome]|jgi:DNA-binding PadR family transcriptional regulator|uniref:Transcription regulator PadR N-terminal domain-containing protein n=1 Tax=bioreactor metagenome TaxID=1076179 RepID=A0A644YML9_9ZZZZ
MSVASELIRGNTETIILAQLMKQDGYGYMVNKAILNLTGGKFELKEATLYTAFRRLEDAGCIVSYWGDETTGARRRYYSITDLGKESYRLRKKEWKTAEAVIDKLLAEGEGESL